MAPVLGLFGYAESGAGVDPRTYGATFARADASTCATYVDSAGVVQTVAANVPRYQHYVSGVGPTLLLEGSRTNKCLRSEALNTSPWIRTATVTEAVGSYAGLSFCRVAGAAGTTTNQGVSFTGDGVKAYSVFVKSDGADGFCYAAIYDNTATAFRGRVKITVASGVVTAAAEVGTLIRVASLASGVYRIEAITTSVTAANVNTFYLYDIQGDRTLTTVLMTGAMAED